MECHDGQLSPAHAWALLPSQTVSPNDVTINGGDGNTAHDNLASSLFYFFYLLAFWGIGNTLVISIYVSLAKQEVFLSSLHSWDSSCFMSATFPAKHKTANDVESITNKRCGMLIHHRVGIKSLYSYFAVGFINPFCLSLCLDCAVFSGLAICSKAHTLGNNQKKKKNMSSATCKIPVEN